MKKIVVGLILCFFFALGVVAGVNTKITYYRNVLVYAYSQANSVYEDDSIKLEIYNQKLWATNKTSKTIFIDLSQCFVVHNGSSFPMFERKQDEKHASKKGVTTSVDEFITIAPATGNKQNSTFICDMTTGLYGNYTTTSTPSGTFTEYDKRLFTIISALTNESKSEDSKGKEYVGTASRHLTEDESINNLGASIAYAFSKRSVDWKNVTLSTWVSDVLLAPYYIKFPKKLKKKDRAGFEAKEINPAVIHIKADSPFEFDIDKSPIILSDWVGNFKKGTFKLKDVAPVKRSDTYKSIISFDGAEADWGKLRYEELP